MQTNNNAMNNASKTTKKYTSGRKFAIALYEGGVQKDAVSVRLSRIVELWLSRGQIVEVDGVYKIA